MEPIVLKNRMAVLTPDPIAEGAFGQVYVGKILNPMGLLAERIVWGEESPRWLGLDDIPFHEPDKDEGKAISLTTSKINYIDPRISVAWAKQNNVRRCIVVGELLFGVARTLKAIASSSLAKR